jgi:hypothetical protein
LVRYFTRIEIRRGFGWMVFSMQAMQSMGVMWKGGVVGEMLEAG